MILEPKPVGTSPGHISTPGSDTLEDIDLFWGETDDVPNREWSKLDEDFTNTGYREGITAGKESALQEGFDDGFARVGAPLGRKIGLLRGVANAAMSFLSQRSSDTDPGALDRHKNEVLGVIGGLRRIHLEDLAPPDLQAQEHAREHLDPGTSSEMPDSAGANAHGINASKSERLHVKPPDEEPLLTQPAVEELDRLRIRLSNVLQELGLVVPLV